MDFKPKGYCFGIIVIWIIAIATFHPGICESVGYTTQQSEYSFKNDLQSVLTKAKRRGLDSRVWRGSSSIIPKFKTSGEHLGDTSKSGMLQGPNQDQNNPDDFKNKCKKGELEHIVQGRLEFVGQASSIQETSQSAHSELQPVVECAETSMTLTVSKRSATQLQIGTGNVLPFSLSQLPPQCGYSIHKSWRDVSMSVQYNGCHVRQEGDRYVLPLLWRSTPLQISCPVSPIKPQASDGLSLCCTQFGLTVGIRGPSVGNQLSVKVRGEWTPLPELVQLCGYRFDRGNAEIRITAPFLACGVTSRDGKYTLTLQIGVEVFTLTCCTSPTEAPPQQHQLPQPTSTTKPIPKTTKPFKWVPPFYLAPPHYPIPKKHRYKTQVYGNTPLSLSPTSAKIQPLETPKQDQKIPIHSAEEYHSFQASSRGSVKILSQPKPSSSQQEKSPTSQPHSHTFNQYYLFYHSPKIPLTTPPPDSGAVVSNPQKPIQNNPMQSAQAHPFPVFGSQIQRGHVKIINDRRIEKKVWPGVDNDRDFVQATGSVKVIRPTNQPLPYGPPRKDKSPTYTYHRLPHDFYQQYHGTYGSQGKKTLTTASLPLLTQTPSPVPPRENLQTTPESRFPQDFYQFYHLYHGQKGEILPSQASTLQEKIPNPSPSEKAQNIFGSYLPHDFYQFYHSLHRPQSENLPTPTMSTTPEKSPALVPPRENPQTSTSSWFPQDFYQFYHLYHGSQGKDLPTQSSITPPQKTPDPSPSEKTQNSFGSHFPQDFSRFHYFFQRPHVEKLPTPTPSTFPQKTPDLIPSKGNIQHGSGSKFPQDFYQYYHSYHRHQDKNVPAPTPPTFPQKTLDPIPRRENLQSSSSSWFPQDFYRFYHLYHERQSQNVPTATTSTLQQITPNSMPLNENLQPGYGSRFPQDFHQFYHLYHGSQGKELLPIPTITTFPQKNPDTIPPRENLQSSSGSRLPQDFNQYYQMYPRQQDKNVPTPTTAIHRQKPFNPIPPSGNFQTSSSWFPQDVYQFHHFFHRPQGEKLPPPTPSTNPQKTPDRIPQRQSLQTSSSSWFPQHFYQYYHLHQQDRNVPTPTTPTLPQTPADLIPPKGNLQPDYGSIFPQDFYRFHHLYHGSHGFQEKYVQTPTSSTLSPKTPFSGPSREILPPGSSSRFPQDVYQYYHLYHGHQDRNVPTPTMSTPFQKTPNPIPPKINLPPGYGSRFPQDFHHIDHSYHGSQGKILPFPTTATAPRKPLEPIPPKGNLKPTSSSWFPQHFQQFYHLYHGSQGQKLPIQTTASFPQKTPDSTPQRENPQPSPGPWFPQEFHNFYHLYHGLPDVQVPTPTPSTHPQKIPDPIPPKENMFGSFSPHYYYQLYHLYNLFHEPSVKSVPSPTSPTLSQETPSPIPPENPAQFSQGMASTKGQKNEGESAAHSDPSFEFNSWEDWFSMLQQPYMFPPPSPVPEEYTPDEANGHDHISPIWTQPFTSPCTPGIGSRFHHAVPSGCLTFAVKECIVGEYFVFSLPEFVVEPKMVGPASSEAACALQRLTPNPHLYFVPLLGCGVSKQDIDALTIYQLEIETCDSGRSILRTLVECSSYPGLSPAETLLILDPFPLQFPDSVQLRIATDESASFHPEAHAPLSLLRGRAVLMELSLLQPLDPAVLLWVHYCLAYTLSPHPSTMLVYDGCLSGSESERLPSPSPGTQFIVVSSFLSLPSPNPSFASDVDPEVYFFCLTEACSVSGGVCMTSCVNSSEQK